MAPPADPWALPPATPWPRFLRLLRRPDPPRGWLEAAADLPDLQRRPLLLRWVAQHPKAPAHLRARLLGRLPWRALAAIARDASAHPRARHLATERLQALWPALTTGERRALAPLAPKPLWAAVWRNPSAAVVGAFLHHPALGLEALVALIQPPLHPAQADALATSPWLASRPVAHQVLVALDRTLALPEAGLVLGHAVPWVKTLGTNARVRIAADLQTPALRRLVHPRRGEDPTGESPAQPPGGPVAPDGGI